MRGFEVESIDVDTFVRRAAEALAQRDLDGVVAVARDGDELVITLSRMATSELRFAVAPLDSGFRATPVSQRISPLHSPFLGMFEQGFADVLTRLGARVI